MPRWVRGSIGRIFLRISRGIMEARNAEGGRWNEKRLACEAGGDSLPP